MKITKNTVVTVQYKLSDAQNNLLEDGSEPIIYLHGGYENVLPAIEKALDGKEVGYTTMIQVEPEEAFGEYDTNLIRIEERSKFPTPLEVGMQFEGVPEDSNDNEEPIIFVVTDIADDKVILDGNHPLAGIALRFSLNVVEVRTATPEEIAHQHAHIPSIHDDEIQEDDQYRSIIIH